MKQNCGTCKWAKWRSLTRTGRPKRGLYGDCTFQAEIVLPPLPACMIMPRFERVVIYPDRGQYCSYYEKVDKCQRLL